MRYMARRIGTGEWLDRDLPLSGVERTRNLSGPGLITATIEPELRVQRHTDGLRILEDWATWVVAVTDAGDLANIGIFVDATYGENGQTANCPGYATYPHGYPYDGARNWGPTSQVKNAKTGAVTPALPRPDPLQIVQDHWAWMQGQPDSNLGVKLIGDLKSSERIGSYEEPYRLRWWETPDLGTEIDNLAGETPFDYVEEYRWRDSSMREFDLNIRLGWPRLGRPRTDLRFALGENVIDTVEAATNGGTFGNALIGLGKGEGSSMVRVTSTLSDGRLRRPRIITDKTKTTAAMQRLVRSLATPMMDTLDITEVQIKDDPNAPIGAINLGDDIYVQTLLPSLGAVQMWVRVLSITQGDDDETATLGTSRSDAFVYSSTTEVPQ